MSERFSLAMTEETRVGRHWDAGGMTVFVHAAPGRVALAMGCRPAGYTDPAQVRELAAWLLEAADRMEDALC